ncbi:DNA cytosine methyltransferase [Amycolatopsis anabasis]|uniref:DNA cytosine methyltransferase n=1 Tax=Amycolatopsis anabasis TaxID=1840409 RepID=UPI00131E69D0|nr:DNA cytosine methyltransferase [Amycolatopsis anabasis]
MLTATDLFCGAGGEAQGGAVYPWLETIYAANHWEQAIETHAANFPNINHVVANISQIDPRYFATTELLWASPECTNHSGAKGVKRALQQAVLQPDMFGETLPIEAAERSRATMWDVVRFTEHHRYKVVVVENVVEAVNWVMWKSWLSAMHAMDYEHHVVYANSMHFPGALTGRAPQSRDRIYVVFWLKGNKAPDLALRPKSYCYSCDEVVEGIQMFKPRTKAWPEERWGRYGKQYFYRCPKLSCRGAEVAPLVSPALTAIDWSMPGQRIGDRDKPLKPATMARIQLGIDRFAFAQLVPAGGTWNDDTTPVTDPMRTRTTRDTEGLLSLPGSAMLIPTEGRAGKQAAPVTQPIRTLTTRAETALLVPYYGTASSATPVSAPIGTLTTRDRYGVAFVATLRGGGSKREVRRVTEPLAAFCANGFHHLLVTGTRDAQDGQMRTPISEPASTFSTGGHQGLVDHEMRPKIQIEDCTFRMLEPHEIQAAMAFGADYTMTGTRRARAKQLGNAVTPPASEWLYGRIGESLGYPTAA